MSRWWLVFFLIFAVTGLAQAADIKEDPLERQMLKIAKDLRCTVCQNQPVSESNADMARDMRQIIREQLQAGKSREQIIDYFVTRYGNFVLMKAPFDAQGGVLWLLPLILAAALLGSGWVYLRNRRRQPPPTLPPLSDEDRARVQAAEAEERQSS